MRQYLPLEDPRLKLIFRAIDFTFFDGRNNDDMGWTKYVDQSYNLLVNITPYQMKKFNWFSTIRYTKALQMLREYIVYEKLSR